ncbi:hypothetical protein [Brevibacterium yomogidense]|nr:hypothetical protein [Brevibacterium yomogidense]
MLEAADAARFRWHDVKDCTDSDDYELVFPGRGENQGMFAHSAWQQIHKEPAQARVTLKLLHNESTDDCIAAGIRPMS